MSPVIALASCDLLPDGDPDDQVLAAALAARGLAAQVISWSDPRADWAGFAATVLRSTWDYTERRAEFLAWAESVPRLHNPSAVIRTNSDKRYLAGLADAAVPVVPTEFFAPAEQVVLPAEGEFVIKPSVGAGSKGAGRFSPDEREAALRHAGDLQAAGRTVMVQPYLAEVDALGETALIFVDGRYSHAIRKGALLVPGNQPLAEGDRLYLTEKISPREPSAAERDLAERVLDQLDGGRSLLYARIDLLPSPDGPRVIEVELTEPSLFLSHAEGAADRLAAAIADRVAPPFDRAAGRP